MPAVSKSQQRLFGYIHAYQTGRTKNAPTKIKNVAKNISMTDAKHFAATKTKGLPNHVKKAMPMLPIEAEKEITTIKSLKAKKGNPEFNSAIHKQAMNYDAFNLGFFKAASANNVDPLLTVRLLKLAWGAGGIETALKDVAHDPNLISNATLPGVGGALLGGAAGYMHGHDQDPAKDHGKRDALLGVLGGGALGAAAGGIQGTNNMYNSLQKGLSPAMHRVGSTGIANAETDSIVHPEHASDNRTGINEILKRVKSFDDSNFLKSLTGFGNTDPILDRGIPDPTIFNKVLKQ